MRATNEYRRKLQKNRIVRKREKERKGERVEKRRNDTPKFPIVRIFFVPDLEERINKKR